MVLLAQVFHVYDLSMGVGDRLSKYRYNYPSYSPMSMQNTMSVIATKLFGAVDEIMNGQIIFHYPAPFFYRDLCVFISVHVCGLKFVDVSLIDVQIKTFYVDFFNITIFNNVVK